MLEIMKKRQSKPLNICPLNDDDQFFVCATSISNQIKIEQMYLHSVHIKALIKI